MTQACKTCAFYADHAGKAREIANAGQCHANPPVPATDETPRAVWPIVSADDWCGRFEAQVA